ncbi:MAG TPA: hypothetical protein VFY84_10390 [Jiangellales bacterium]|nr:hypothetical protein [Jiangellales bacterium]
MRRAGRVLRYVAFGVGALFGLFGGMFIAGNAFADPGGWPAAGMTALWAIPLVGICTFALLRPAAAGPVLIALTGMVAVFTIADSAFGIIPRDDWGPVAAIAVFALAVALAFLGLRRARLAGLLMVLAGLAQLTATLMGIAIEATDGPGPDAALGGSSGAVVVPLLVLGALFLLAGVLEDRDQGDSGRFAASGAVNAPPRL